MILPGASQLAWGKRGRVPVGGARIQPLRYLANPFGSDKVCLKVEFTSLVRGIYLEAAPILE
jgi:hypothetical protein